MNNKSKFPKVSIIIVNWNGKHFLKMCLPSLAKITYLNYEVIVVDNGSTDDSVKTVKELRVNGLRVIENKENLGFAEANNIGIKAAAGDYILLLNNDTEVTADFLDILMKKLESSPRIACVQPKICTLKDRSLLDSVGSFLTDNGFLYHYGRLKKADLPMFNKPLPIYSAKGAAMLLRRSVLDKVGLFDPDFFAYFEETDLCHRIWLAGYKIIYEPRSVIYHVVAGTSLKLLTNTQMFYLSLRNRICSFAKNLGRKELAKIFSPLIVIYSVLFWFYLATFKFGLAWAIIRAVFWNFENLPTTLTKRKIVQQKIRKISDEELMKLIKINPPLKYYYYLLTDNLAGFRDKEISELPNGKLA